MAKDKKPTATSRMILDDVVVEKVNATTEEMLTKRLDIGGMPAKLGPRLLTIGDTNWVNEASYATGVEMGGIARGHVLEIGFGCGGSHMAMHANSDVKSITVLELYQEVLDHYKTCECICLVGDWKRLVIPPREFDCVLFHVGQIDPLLAETIRIALAPKGFVIFEDSGGNIVIQG